MQASLEVPGTRDVHGVPAAAPLVEVNRGNITESRHRGHIVAVDGDGKEIASLGDAEIVTFLRSSAKPFQALPLLLTGAADRFNFTEEEVALACASHNGEPIHVQIVSSMLKKIGLSVSDLKCGVHEPYSAPEAKRLRELGEAPTALHNNCSGKHAGMLAVAQHLGAPTQTYDQADNPVQIAVRDEIARFADCSSEDLAVGVDGCGVPVYGMSVRAMARMYARLATGADRDDPTAAACRRIVAAMTNHPELIGGTHDRLDTEMMRASKGTLVSKVGAEGVYTAGIFPSRNWPSGLGLAIKIEDGDDYRARPTVVIESLRQLGVLDDEALAALAQFARFTIKNRRGDHVGEVRPSFELHRRSA